MSAAVPDATAGIAAGADDPRPESDGGRDRSLGELLRPIRGRLVAAILCEAVGAVAAVVPFVAVVELARVLLAPGPVDEPRAWTVALIGAAALLLRFTCVATAAAITHFADVQLQLHIRRRVAARLGLVPLGWFTARASGEVKKALQDDVNALHHLVGHALIDLTAAVVTPVVALAYLLWVDWRMTLVTLIPLVAGLLLYVRQWAGYGENMVRYNEALGRINSAVVEFVQGIAVVKTFGQTRRAHNRFVRAADDFADFFLGWVRDTLRPAAASEIVLSPLAVLTVVLAGGTLFVANRWIAPIDVLPFALLGLGLTAPVLALGYSTHQLQLAQQAATRLTALANTPPLPEADRGRRPDGHRVVFDSVRFSYDGTTEVLTGIDLVMEPGTTTALVGPSGSGKTTLARLLPRFWDPGGGSITVGGVDLRDLPGAELYRHVSFVFQDVQLLRTTVRDNLLLSLRSTHNGPGRPDAGDADVEAAARAAQIHERILELPRGYDAVVGEDALLSGGEAQRVSIARALLADTPVLVLDEATAFADPESEAAIQDAISQLVAGRTLLVIAHRLSTIAGADQIVVLDGGRVVQRGRHHELVTADGRYARMWAAHERARRTRLHASPLQPKPALAPDATTGEVPR